MKVKSEIPSDKLELYNKLIATNPGIERRGVTMPYTSYQGNMFTYLSKTGLLCIRLPKDELEKFIKQFNTSLCESYGAVMKEYVTVPDDLLKDTKKMKKYLDLSYAYVKTLKPKLTKK